MGEWQRMLKFAVVGLIAFFLDWAALALILKVAPIFLLARALSFFVSVVFTFVCNKFWTFRGHAPGSILNQFARFVSTHLVGMSLNYAVSTTVAMTLSMTSGLWLGVALAAGSLAGMVFNYEMSHRYVFKRGGAAELRPSEDRGA